MAPPSILVVEDNPVTRKMLRVTLESENIRVLEAGDGRTAIALVEQHRPDLVLQDLILPDMDGLELIRRLRSLPGAGAVPILALSGFLSRLEESQTAEAGFSALLVKPIEPRALLEAIHAHLPHVHARPEGPGGERPQVLVVGDDAVQVKSTRVQLTHLGFEARAAGSVPEALRLARRSAPALILSDVFMPGEDGFQLCQHVRQDPALSRVPVVLVSVHYGTRDDHALARRVGATAFVMRTPGFPALERIVREAIAHGVPPLPEGADEQISLHHAKAVIRQLEQQLAGLSGLTQRCALQAAQLSLLGGVADALTRRADIDAALRDVIAATLDAAGISKGALMLIEDGVLRVRPAIGFSDAERAALPEFFGYRAVLEGFIARGASVTIPSSAIDGVTGEEILRAAGVESMHVVPLIASGAGMGALVIGASRTDVTAHDSVAFARAIGNQIVQTLQLSKSIASLTASEQRYRTLLDRASDAIAVLGPDGVMREVNQGWERLLMRPRHEILGRRIGDFATTGRDGETGAPSAAAEPPEGGTATVELLRADGSTALLELSATRLHVDGETLVLSIGRDVTAQHRLEEQLRQAQKLEAIGQLAGGVAHDFNNLLTAILGFADLMAASLHPANPALADLGEIKRAGERAAALTRQLLAFGRKQILQPAVLDINTVIAELEPMLRRLLVETVMLRIEPHATRALVMMDPTQIEQILINLAVNAADAMSRAGGTLTIRTSVVSIGSGPEGERMLPPGSYVVLTVSDTGIGMSDEVVERIFEPFYTTKGPGKGTGLGLATVYGIVKQSGGDIQVSSEPGRGTTFEIVLPEAQVTTGDAVDRSRSVGDLPSGSETILIVEDDAAVRRLARMTLERKGYTVIEAPNPREAERLAAEHPGDIHLMLSDVIMPESEGPPLADRLAARHPGVRVLYMSGYADETIVQHGLIADGTSFLQKPFSPEVLLRSVREMLTG